MALSEDTKRHIQSSLQRAREHDPVRFAYHTESGGPRCYCKVFADIEDDCTEQSIRQRGGDVESYLQTRDDVRVNFEEAVEYAAACMGLVG